MGNCAAFLPSKSYTPQNLTKREAKTILQKFDPVQKAFSVDFFESKDLRKKPRNINENLLKIKNVDLKIYFSGETVGRLRDIFSIRNANIIFYIREIFNNSQYAYSSNYIINEKRPDGSIHKEHSNIEAYHHFINKVVVDKNIYYIRFTIHEERKAIGKLHSAHASKLDLIKKISRDSSCSLPGFDRGGTVQSAYDLNLLEFLDFVK